MIFPKEDQVKINAFFMISRDELETFIERMDPFIDKIVKNDDLHLQKKLRKLRIIREIGSEQWIECTQVYRKAKKKGYGANGRIGSKKTFDRDIIELQIEGFIHLKKREGKWITIREDSKIYEIEE